MVASHMAMPYRRSDNCASPVCLTDMEIVIQDALKNARCRFIQEPGHGGFSRSKTLAAFAVEVEI